MINYERVLSLLKETDKKRGDKMMEMKDVLNLLGKELKDGSEQAKRFREFVE